MLVCLCHPLSDRELAELVEDGADSVEEIGRRCGAGTSCGACVEELAEAVLEREQGAEATAGRSLCARLGERGRGVEARPRCVGALVPLGARGPTS